MILGEMTDANKRMNPIHADKRMNAIYFRSNPAYICNRIRINLEIRIWIPYQILALVKFALS